ncbi:hypothetical protein E9840_04205 [Tissierella creatinini]|nr:hypothetical protein E9840_04205 [Tissierella creatinini]TJX66347.1 hypothetical protein E8P77_08130 [Soehngenia saccharolytica]
MAVQKMTMMNIIGNIEDIDSVVLDVLKANNVNLISALNQIEDNKFLFNVKDENLEKYVELNFATSFKTDMEYEKLKKKVLELKDILHIHEDGIKEYETILTKDEIIAELNGFYDEIHEVSEDLKTKKESLNALTNLYNSFPETTEIPFPVEKLRGLTNVTYRMGKLSKEARLKLKKNYENILAIVIHTASTKDGEIYMMFYPSILNEEMNRILRSLNFKEILIPDSYRGSYKEIKQQIGEEKRTLEKEIEVVEGTISKYKEDYEKKLLFLTNHVDIKLKIEDIKEKLARSSKYFYLSGWVPKKEKSQLEAALNKYKDTLILFNEEGDQHPPTKLKNIRLFRPFETLVRLYGMPSYEEIDPTPFLSLSYMFLFGAMFGDLGQGFVILLSGLLFSRKNKLFGGLLSRLGLSSMIFGTFYGAVFGFEDIIPALIIRPFESINTILMAAIVVGIVLILIAYTLSMVNAYKRKDLEEGLFGKEGLAGLLFYLILLALAASKIIGRYFVHPILSLAIILLCLLSMVFKQPLTNLIKNERPLHGHDISGYYVESIFSLLETLLSMLSGTVSFIRVGAFALTHVGLFIAFETIGEMIGHAAGNAIVLIIGNILILGLEGLIVFIQGLRLEYYEMFSRYYKGDGKEFEPASLDRKK